jgi:hypothetical protein
MGVKVIPVGFREWALVVDGEVIQIFKNKRLAEEAKRVQERMALRQAFGVVGD